MVRRARDYLRQHQTIDIVLLAGVSLTAAGGWFHSGLPTGHDALADMLLAQAASQGPPLGNLLTGWSGNWSLGYPLFHVNAPLASYLIWALGSLFGWVAGTKVLYLLFFVLAGILAYRYVWEIARSRPAAFVAGLAYVFLPYAVLEIGYEGHHGAFGLPYMLTPLVLLLVERTIERPAARYVLIIAGALVLLTLTYPQVLPFLLGPFLVAYVMARIWWNRHRGGGYLRRVTVILGAALLLSLGLSAFWWLPMLAEVRYFAAVSFPLDDARGYSATFLEAIALRPSFCCAPAAAFGAGGTPVQVLRLLPFMLVILGVILNRRDRHVWFFAASIVLGVLLAMGPASPIKLFSLAQRCVPFFSGIRTPWRFLLFTSLAYSVLIGFCVKGLIERTATWHLRWRWNRWERLRIPATAMVILALACLVVLGNTWGETRAAFGTFSLTADQSAAYAWLAAEGDGDYRIADPPFEPYASAADGRFIIRPSYWTYLHGKENLYGSTRGVKYALSVLASLNADLEAGPVDLRHWLGLFNVKYILIDKTDPYAGNLMRGADYVMVWSSSSIDIYANRAVGPRVFSLLETGERDLALWSPEGVNAFLTEGSREAALSLGATHARSSGLTLDGRFELSGSGPEWSKLGIDASQVPLKPGDALRLDFYSDRDLPGTYVTLEARESDGSCYGAELCSLDGVRSGWNELELPLSLLLLRDPVGQDDELDFDQISTIQFGVGHKEGVGTVGAFTLCFDRLAVVSQETRTDLEYARRGSGRYEVQIRSDTPQRLVLSESFHPDWVARANGSTIHSQMIYESLNAFELPPGEYSVTLEFVASPLRKAGMVASGVGLLLFLVLAGVLLVRWNSGRARAAPGPPSSP